MVAGRHGRVAAGWRPARYCQDEVRVVTAADGGRRGNAPDTALAPLRVQRFRRYLAGQLISVTCSWMQVVALTSIVVQVDPQAVSLIVTLQFLPMLGAPVFGVLADRIDRRRLMAAEAGLGLVAVVYAALAVIGPVTIGRLVVVALLWGLVNAVDTPARQAFLIDLVPVTSASRASLLTGLAVLTGMKLGSAAGAVLFDRVGFAVCCLINAASFFVDVAILATISVDSLPSPRPRSRSHAPPARGPQSSTWPKPLDHER